METELSMEIRTQPATQLKDELLDGVNMLIAGGDTLLGRMLVKEAVYRGADVTVLVENPERINFNDYHLTVVNGSVMNRALIDKVIGGKQVVISTLGGVEKEDTRRLPSGTSNIIQAMQEHGVKRLICLSSSAAYHKETVIISGPYIIPVTLRHVFDEIREQLEMVRKCKLDWTVVRPVKQVSGPHTGKYSITFDRANGKKISMPDLVDFMLQQVKSQTYYNKMPVISEWENAKVKPLS